MKYTRGQPTARWERIPGRRAESLDCFLYGWAVRSLVQTDPVRRSNELRGLATGPKLPTIIRSKWLSGERRVAAWLAIRKGRNHLKHQGW